MVIGIRRRPLVVSARQLVPTPIGPLDVFSTLTSREWEVLELMREDLTTAEIAERLFVSPVTVRSHIAAVLRKLRVPDRKAALKLLEER